MGENGAGKTTALRSLNNIFAGKYLHYILVMQSNENYVVYTNMDSLVVDESIVRCEKVVTEGDKIASLWERNQVFFRLVYFSHIFDRAHLFQEHKNLIDISTNNEWNNQIVKNVDETSTNRITNYRSDSIIERLPFFNYLYTELAECKKLFDFPQKIDMLFVVDVKKINQKLNELQKSDNFYLDFLLKIAEEIENRLENIKDGREKILKEYEFYGVYSLLLYCAIHEVTGIEDAIYFILDKLEMEEEIHFGIELFIERLEEININKSELVQNRTDSNKNIEVYDDDIYYKTLCKEQIWIIFMQNIFIRIYLFLYIIWCQYVKYVTLLLKGQKNLIHLI